MSKLTKEDAVACLKDYITSEQEFLQQLKQKQCLVAEFLPQIEEQQMMSGPNNGVNNDSFKEMAKILTDNAYEVVKFLGQGSFGIVISVKQSNKRYAFKGISNAGNDENRNKIRQEFDNQVKVRDSEYIVQSLSLLDYDDWFFISLEHCLCNLDNFFELQIPNPEDPTKKQLISLNEPTVIKMIYEIASGMAHVHSKRTAIRDIKPENIMINYNLKCQIGDFGLSKNFQINQLKSSVNKGNMMFMAPEIFKWGSSNKQNQEQNQKQSQEQSQKQSQEKSQKGSQDQQSQKESQEQQSQKENKVQQNQKDNNYIFIQGDLYSLGLLLGFLILGKDSQNLIFNAKFTGKQELIAKIQECMVQKGYQFQTEIINIINNLISDVPEERQSAEQVRKELKKMYDHFGFDKIIHKNLRENRPMVNIIRQYFKNGVEFIPSFNKEVILSISQSVQQQLCPQLPNDSVVFYKTMTQFKGGKCQDNNSSFEQKAFELDDFNLNNTFGYHFDNEKKPFLQDVNLVSKQTGETLSNQGSLKQIQPHCENNNHNSEYDKKLQEEKNKLLEEKKAAEILQQQKDEEKMLKEIELKQQLKSKEEEAQKLLKEKQEADKKILEIELDNKQKILEAQEQNKKILEAQNKVVSLQEAQKKQLLEDQKKQILIKETEKQLQLLKEQQETEKKRLEALRQAKLGRLKQEKQKILDLQNDLIFDLYPSRPLKLDTQITVKKEDKLQLYIILFLIIIVSCEEIVFDILHILESKLQTPFEDMKILLWVRLVIIILQILCIFLYLDKIFVRNHTEFPLIHKSVTLLFSCFFGAISIGNDLSRLQFFETMPDILFYFSLSIQAVLLLVSLCLIYLTKKRKFCTIQWRDNKSSKKTAYYAPYLNQYIEDPMKCT